MRASQEPVASGTATNSYGAWKHLRLRGHLGITVCVTSVTSKLMHMPHDFAQNIDFTIAVASVLYLRLVEAALLLSSAAFTWLMIWMQIPKSAVTSAAFAAEASMCWGSVLLSCYSLPDLLSVLSQVVARAHHICYNNTCSRSVASKRSCSCISSNLSSRSFAKNSGQCITADACGKHWQILCS